jgi:hypothetical protein
MSQEDLMILIFCCIDDELKAMNLDRLRQRGPQPTLADSEVIAIEIAGELLGFDRDKASYSFCREHFAHLFPGLRRIGRTSFVRQAANTWRIKQLLQQRLAQAVLRAMPDPPLWILDSFPLAVCRFARAPGCKRFAGVADKGFDHTINAVYYGFRVHLRVADCGVVAQFDVAPARIHDTDLAPELTPARDGPTLGDRNYWDPLLREELLAEGKVLIAPFRRESTDPWPGRSALISRLRQVIEPVIGQLAVRLNAKSTWVKDLWHLCSRLTRKVLAHTLAVFLNARLGNPLLCLEALMAD